MASTWTRHPILNNKNISVKNNNSNTKEETTKHILVPPKGTFLELPRITVIYVAILSLNKPTIPAPFHVSCFVKYFYDNDEPADESPYHSFTGEDCLRKFLKKLSQIGDSLGAELAKMNRNSVPVVIHEFSKYASHFKLENLPRFRFVDPDKFLIDCTFDRLMEDFEDISAISFPFDFLNDSEKINLRELPPDFDERAREALRVVGCRNLEEYAELYDKFQVLSLCYIFEKLRDRYKKEHKLEMLDQIHISSDD